jgi:hypothetical protein
LAASLVAAFGSQLGSYAIKASSVPEVQKLTVSGPLTGTTYGLITVLGVSIQLTSTDTADTVADRIVSATNLWRDCFPASFDYRREMKQ